MIGKLAKNFYMFFTGFCSSIFDFINRKTGLGRLAPYLAPYLTPIMLPDELVIFNNAS